MTNIKLTIIDKADWFEVQKFAHFAETQGYTVTIIDNGNIVLEKGK